MEPQSIYAPWFLGIWVLTQPRGRLHARSRHRENILYGEYLVNAQGEDVVAGIRTPQTHSRAKEGNAKNLSGIGAGQKNLGRTFS